ncbi:MAG: alpha-2-macroglobulin family protein, partial [Chloroflexota bacterium]
MTLDENGTVAGEFAIPDGVNPGQYNLEFYDSRGDLYASSFIRVAEFRKPEFEVAVSSEETDILRGSPAQVAVEANYFFGGVASDLELTYTVYETPYFFSHSSPYRFGESLPFYWFYDQQQGFENWLFSGEGRTDADGRFVINLPADLLAEIENGSRNITVEATVFDVSFQPFSARTSLVYHESEVYVGIQSDTYIGEVDEPLNFELLTVDWDGEPVADTPTEVVFYRREWERGENGWYEEVETEVDRASVTTDGDGIASITFTTDQGGSYKAVATATDAGGRTNSSTAYLWVTGGGRWRIEANDKTMQLVPNQLEYAVGDRAEILIQSPFEGPISAWLNIERGNILEQRLITLNSTGDTIALPITLDHVPNVYVTIVAVKGENEIESGTLPSADDYADIRVGMINLPVKIDPFKLNVELTPRLPDSGLFQPGETATFDVSITNQNGQPIQGTVSLALVDKAIFSLAADSNVPIEQAFYSEQPYRSLLGSGLIFSGEGYERPPEEIAADEPVELAVAQTEALEVEAEAIVEESALAAPAAEADFAADDAAVGRAAGGEALAVDIDIRTDFRDTAYWEAAVTTDGNGQAVVEIPLPDNLTTWKLHVKGLTTETLVGQQDTEIVVQKPLLLRPMTPRFFTVGDVAEIGTVINNNTAEDLEVTVTVEGTGFEFINETSEATVTVPANGSTTVRQPIRISDRNVDFVDLTFTAVSSDGRYADGSKPTFGIAPDQLLPVYRYNAEDIVATSGVLDSEEARRVEAVLLPDGIDQDFGNITFKLNGSLAAAVLDGLEAQNNEIYDTSCAHAVADRLIPNAVTARAISQLNLDQAELKAELDGLIPTDIGHLVEAQKGDGGWGWCYWPESNPWFSAYVMLALDKAAEAGYSVPEATLQSGISYIENQLIVPGRLEGGQSYAANAQAFYHYVLAEVGAAQAGMAADLYAEQRENLDAYATGLLLIALHETEPDLVETMLADISGAALVSATGAHWEDNDWNNLSSDIRATAIMIMAFAQVSPDEAFGPQAVNWLMGARKAQVWRSRHDTAWVLLGLTDWLVETGELEGDYTYSILMNGESQIDAAFNGENIAETTTLPVPMIDMSAEEINFFDIQKQGDGRLYYNAYLDAFIPADLVGPIDRGLNIERRFYDASCPADSGECEPITEIEAGQQIRVELTIITKRDLVYAIIEDYFPAGAEPIDPNLPISQQALGGGIERQVDQDRYWGWWGW